MKKKNLVGWCFRTMDKVDKHDRSCLKNLDRKNIWHLIAVGFGSGLAPKAPGTFGSLAAIPLCMILIYLPLSVSLVIIALTFLIGWYSCVVTEKALGMHDCSSIVIDEFVGMFVSVLFFPQEWFLAFLAFVFFRVFDILKPFPIGYLDKHIKGGLGIMVDDVLAGIAACVLAQIIFYFAPHAVGL